MRNMRYQGLVNHQKTHKQHCHYLYVTIQQKVSMPGVFVASLELTVRSNNSTLKKPNHFPFQLLLVPIEIWLVLLLIAIFWKLNFMLLQNSHILEVIRRLWTSVPVELSGKGQQSQDAALTNGWHMPYLHALHTLVYDVVNLFFL